MNKFQLTHLVTLSPWPILGAFSTMLMMMSFIALVTYKLFVVFLMSLFISLLVFFSWSSDIFSESSLEGAHSFKTSSTLKVGMMLFIVSEVFLFISMFWAFFHSSISSSVDLGMEWPPLMIHSFNYEEIPMLNTVILVSSGMTLTLAHHFLMEKEMDNSIKMMILTVNLGLMFSMIQVVEYFEAGFSINDSVFGSSFFMATGLHGVHVIVGSIFLLVVMFQIKMMRSSCNQFISFEMAAWYWHFVDVVWLFLLITIYWWGA